MTDTTSPPRRAGPRAETIIIALIVFVGLVAGWYLLSQRQQILRMSPSGLDGLQVWLTANDVKAQNFSGGWLIDQNSVGLLVVPLYDTSLDQARLPPTSKQALLLQQDEYDLLSEPLLEKAGRVPTLVVLPKWRTGMRLTGRAHPVLLTDREKLSRSLSRLLDTDAPEIARARDSFTDFAYRAQDGEQLRAELYLAQTFSAPGCKPVLGTPEAILLAECPLANMSGGETVLVLADPDLINNHGLRLSDNAGVALDIFRTHAGERAVIIDYSQDVWLRDPTKQPQRERSWADLRRFFTPPFLTLWIGGGLVLVLALWRASLRYGPVRAGKRGPGASKALAVGARARLMRLSGQDGALTGEYAAARIAAKAETLLGAAHARPYASREDFLRYADRRHPALASRLRSIMTEIQSLPVYLPASEAIHQIDELERILEQMNHDA